MFDTTKEDLKDLLRYAHEGRLQLPDFQRDYVWGDEDVRSLIASVAKGFPVGALLTLQAGVMSGSNPAFSPVSPPRVSTQTNYFSTANSGSHPCTSQPMPTSLFELELTAEPKWIASII